MQRARRRALIIWVAVGALVLACVAAAIAFAAAGTADPEGSASSSPSSSPMPSVTATPAPAAAATATGVLDDTEAEDVLDAALAVPLASVGTSDDLDALLENIASDAYAAELEAQWQELVSQGWTIAGTPSLISVEVTSLDRAAEPATATVTACVDSSTVSILDADGDQVGDDSAKVPRARHLFTLAQGQDGLWRITAHAFPDDPIC